MRSRLRTIALVLAAIVLTAGRSEPVYTVQDQPVPPSVVRKLHGEQYVHLFADAALQRGWRPLPVAPGQIRASLLIKGKHSLTVDILYDSQFYSIVLVSSEALNQGDGRIHPAANKAIRGLQDAIQAALARAAF